MLPAIGDPICFGQPRSGGPAGFRLRAERFHLSEARAVADGAVHGRCSMNLLRDLVEPFRDGHCRLQLDWYRLHAGDRAVCRHLVVPAAKT